MKHYITFAIAGLALIAILLVMFFKLNIFMVIPALIVFEVADNAYESIKEERKW